MSIDSQTLLAILVMAVITYLTRLLGALAVERLRFQGRTATAFEAVPTAVLTAVIAPSVLASSPADACAAVVTIFAAARLPLIATVVVGVLAAVLFRALLGGTH